MNITVQGNNMSLDFIPVGEVLTFEKDKENDYYEDTIKAFYQNDFIGYVAAVATVLQPGCVLNTEIAKHVGDTFEGKVIRQATAPGVSSKKVLVVEVEGTGTANPSNGNTLETKEFRLHVKGSTSAYPDKTAVINEVKLGRKVFLQLDVVKSSVKDKETGDAKEVERIVATRVVGGVRVKSGVVDDKAKLGCSTPEDIAVLKEIIKNGSTQIEGYVDSAASATVYTLVVQVANNVIDTFKLASQKKANGDIKTDLVKKGFDKTVLGEIEDYLIGNGFTPTEIQNIFKTYKTPQAPALTRIVTQPKVLFEDTFGALKICYAALLNGYHLLLSGDKGTGKNCLISTWAWITQRPLYSSSINRETDKLDVLGSKTIEVEVDEKTGKTIDKIVFKQEILLDAMENGGIANIDEINFADPGITGLLHSICDDRRELEVPGYKKVTSEENFCIMATMNIDYQGTNELNEALRDRFINIRFPNNDSIENILSVNCPKSPQKDINVANKIYSKMYSMVQNNDNEIDANCLTVRGFIQALSMADVLGLKTALNVCVADKIDDKEYCEKVKEIIKSYVK